MEGNHNSDALTNALEAFLRPIITKVISESLTEVFLKLEKKRARRYYTREEACEHLKIGTTTFYRLVNKGKITLLKIEGKTLVDADELDDAIRKKEVFRYKH